MAQLVSTKLELENNKKITRFKSLVITQDLFRHHRFEMTVPFNELESKDDIFFQHSHKDVCGKSLQVSFETVDKKKSFLCEFFIMMLVYIYVCSFNIIITKSTRAYVLGLPISMRFLF